MLAARYRFVDRLAVGGMAEVFVAIAEGAQGFEKPVVIKQLLPELAAIERFRKMFIDEARITANLQHGNIVQILDMGMMGELPFLALEYVDGRDLRTVHYRAADGGQTIPLGVAAYIGSEVCRALDYAHRKCDAGGKPLDIVHRDINPANVFLSHEGQVKVGDFGLAKAADNIERSDTGIVKGKLSYLSPEQARGEQADQRSDIFSLGTTLYELTCGKLPFRGNNDYEVVLAIREGAYAPPSAIVEGYDPALEAIVGRALSRDLDARYATAGEMRTDLARWLQRQAEPVGDRQLAAFLAQLFGSERRSNSFLIRLPEAHALPKPVTSVSHAGGLSRFEPTSPAVGFDLPSHEDPTGRRAPPEVAGRQATGPMRTGALPTGPMPIAPELLVDAGQGKRRSTTGVLAIAGAIVIAAALVAGALLVPRLITRPTAALRVSSTPINARIVLDGRDTGKRTPALLSNLALDRDYRVTLRHGQTEPKSRRFRFSEPGAYDNSFVLRYKRHLLSLRSEPPRADIVVDGQLRGQTPLTLRLLRGKRYELSLTKRGYKAKRLQHHAEGARAALELSLVGESAKAAVAVRRAHRRRPHRRQHRRTPTAGRPMVALQTGPGTLEVATDAVARVYINGRYLGRTPNLRRRVPPGRYRVKVVPVSGGIEHKGLVRVASGKTARLTLTP